jgi:hypothetical protein
MGCEVPDRKKKARPVSDDDEPFLTYDEDNGISDDEARQQLASLRNRLQKLNAIYERFGKDRDLQAIRELENEVASLPEHILNEEKIIAKLAELDATVRAYVTRRRLKNLPPVPDIWAAVKGFEQQHDSNDLGSSSLLKTILREARKLNIPDKRLEQTVREAEKAV